MRFRMASIRSGIGENMEDRYLFKAKRLDNGEWVIGYYGVIGERNVIIEKYAENYYCPDTCESRHGNQIHEVNSKTICQCTGLKDKNGKLIWENDIIHKPFYTDYDAYANSEAYTGRIQYEDGGWSVEITKPDGNVCVSPIIEMIAYSKDIEHFEVIGNIFDNKELLESEEK